MIEPSGLSVPRYYPHQTRRPTEYTPPVDIRASGTRALGVQTVTCEPVVARLGSGRQVFAPLERRRCNSGDRARGEASHWPTSRGNPKGDLEPDRQVREAVTRRQPNDHRGRGHRVERRAAGHPGVIGGFSAKLSTAAAISTTPDNALIAVSERFWRATSRRGPETRRECRPMKAIRQRADASGDGKSQQRAAVPAAGSGCRARPSRGFWREAVSTDKRWKSRQDRACQCDVRGAQPVVTALRRRRRTQWPLHRLPPNRARCMGIRVGDVHHLVEPIDQRGRLNAASCASRKLTDWPVTVTCAGRPRRGGQRASRVRGRRPDRRDSSVAAGP